MTVSYNLFYVVFFISSSFLYLTIFIKRYFREHPVINDILGIIFICLFSLWASFRPKTVPDTRNYYGIYSIIDKISFGFGGVFNRVKAVDAEYGFALLTRFLKMLGCSFMIYMFIIALIKNINTVLGIRFMCEYIDKKHKYDYFTVFVLFLIFLGLHNFCIAVRAGLSIGFGLCGIGVFLKYKKTVLAVLLILLSILFQSMGIVFVPIMIMCAVKINLEKKQFLYIWLASFFLVLLGIPGYFVKIIVKILLLIISRLGVSAFNEYLEATSGGGNAAINVIFRVFSFGLITWMAYRKDEKFKKIAVVMLLGILAQTFCYPIEGLYRVMEYLFIFIIPIIAVVIKNSRKCITKYDICYLIYYIFLIMQIRLCYSPEKEGQENVFSLIT